MPTVFVPLLLEGAWGKMNTGVFSKDIVEVIPSRSLEIRWRPGLLPEHLENLPRDGPSPVRDDSETQDLKHATSRDPFCRVRKGCCRLTPVSAHSSVPAGQMGSRAMVFGRPRYAGNLNALACVLDSGNRHGSPCRGRSAQALKQSQLPAPSLGSTDG
jgi:hypothetical protein